MKYEQEKNKINKLWEKSQKNQNELNKKENDSLIVTPNNFRKKIIPIDNSGWVMITPHYSGKGNYDTTFFPEANRTYWIVNITEFNFYSSMMHLQVYKSGSLFIDKKITASSYEPFPSPEWQEGYNYYSGDIVNGVGYNYICLVSHLSTEGNRPPNESYWGQTEKIIYYRYIFTPEEQANITYAGNFTWRVRLWGTNRFDDWSDFKSFYTYPYFIPPTPRSDVSLFSLGYFNPANNYIFPPSFTSHYFDNFLGTAYLMSGVKGYGFQFDNNMGKWNEIGNVINDLQSDLIYQADGTISTNSSGISIIGDGVPGGIKFGGNSVFEPTYHNIKFKIVCNSSGWFDSEWYDEHFFSYPIGILVKVYTDYYCTNLLTNFSLLVGESGESGEIDATGYTTLFIRVWVGSGQHAYNENIQIDLPITDYTLGSLSESISVYLKS